MFLPLQALNLIWYRARGRLGNGDLSNRDRVLPGTGEPDLQRQESVPTLAHRFQMTKDRRSGIDREES
jgi:hypothetical protein